MVKTSRWLLPAPPFVQLTPESKPRILHRERPDGKCVEFSTERIDELYNESLAAIPFDSSTNWEGWLKASVEKGELEQATIKLDGVPIGLITYAFTGAKFKELLISTAYIRPQHYDFIPLLTTFAKKLAHENNCKFIRFHTARKGLVRKAIEQGFHVSEIVCRLTL
jgi:hypothetical protein